MPFQVPHALTTAGSRCSFEKWGCDFLEDCVNLGPEIMGQVAWSGANEWCQILGVSLKMLLDVSFATLDTQVGLGY